MARRRIVIALGGNAILRRGEAPTMENQRRNVRAACRPIAPLAADNDLVISHGNGPQVGMLALQQQQSGQQLPLDVLGAETERMLGYMIEQELGNLVPFERPFATMLTMVEVDPADPAFQNPTKPIGPMYTGRRSARRVGTERGWTVAQDGSGWRRVVASPLPKRIFEMRPIRWLLERNTIVICAGGGGIPTMYLRTAPLAGADVVDRQGPRQRGARARSGRRSVRHGDRRPGRVCGLGHVEAPPVARTTPAELRAPAFRRRLHGP